MVADIGIPRPRRDPTRAQASGHRCTFADAPSLSSFDHSTGFVSSGVKFNAVRVIADLVSHRVKKRNGFLAIRVRTLSMLGDKTLYGRRVEVQEK